MNKYICFRKVSIILAISSMLSIGFFAALQVIFDFQNVYGLFAALGSFIVTLHQVSVRDRSLSFKINSGIVFSALMSIAITLGCIYASDLIISSVILLLFSFLVGYTAKSDIAFANGILFIADMYVIGTGFKSNISISLLTGVLSFVGGVIFIGILTVLSKQFNNADSHNKSKQNIKIIADKESTLYAISLSLGLIVGNFISIYFNIEIGYWIPMTVLLIFKPDVTCSSTAIKHRLVGTILGSIFAVPIVTYISNPYLIWGILLIITFFTICCIIKHYGSYVFFLTIFIALLLKLAHMSGYDISVSRLVYTLAGIAIVAIVIVGSRYIEKIKFTKSIGF